MRSVFKEVVITCITAGYFKKPMTTSVIQTKVVSRHCEPAFYSAVMVVTLVLAL
jgi:hypothetical protein